MTKNELKARVCQAIAARKQEILALGNAIYAEPELGYKETKTAAKVEAAFTSLGLDYTKGHALTGVKARMKGKASKRTVAMLGELDAIVCPDHPMADTTSGAAHCCGHNVQIAAMVAVGMGLKDAGAMQHLGGDVVLFAVPAEEYVEITYRNNLREQGKIEYFGGKAELIRLGDFDDVDMALQMHVQTTANQQELDSGKGSVALSSTSNGFIGKLVQYTGRASHAAAAPDQGVNALNACMMGVMGVNALRDTFKESDYVRFHPIITQGGDLVNVVPSDVRMESYVRAASTVALKGYNEKINRALEAGAMALGAGVKIQDLPGYLPLYNDTSLNDLFGANAGELVGEEKVVLAPHMSGSTDTGDLSHIMPVCHPWVGGCSGSLHAKNYAIFDEELVYIQTAQAMAMTIIDLLYGEAETAEQVLHSHKNLMSKAEYLAFMESVNKTTTFGE